MSGSVRDKNIGWNRKFLFIGPDFQNFKNVAASDIFVPADGLAADVLTEIGTTDLFAPLVTAAGALDTGSSFVVGPRAIPYDMDTNREIGVGVVYTHDQTGTLTSATWAVTYSTILFGLTNVGVYNSFGAAVAGAAVTEPTTALDTVIAAQTNMTANALEMLVSPRGSIKPNTLKVNSGLWAFRARLSAASAVTDKIFFLGLLIEYVPRKTKGIGVASDPQIPQNYLDNNYEPKVTAPNSNP